MDQSAAFLQAILAAPDDDTPRLVYADWLDDVGEAARAEFIRVQCELAAIERRYGPRSQVVGDGVSVRVTFNGLEGTPNEEALCRRERELWRPEEVLQPYPGMRLAVSQSDPDRHTVWFSDCIGYTFCRGFVEQITCSWADCRDHLDAVRLAHPLRKVQLTTRWPVRQNSLMPHRFAILHPSVPLMRQSLQGRLKLRQHPRDLAVFGHLKGGQGSVPRCKWYDSLAQALAVWRDALRAEWKGVDFALPSEPVEFSLDVEPWNVDLAVTPELLRDSAAAAALARGCMSIDEARRYHGFDDGGYR